MNEVEKDMIGKTIQLVDKKGMVSFHGVVVRYEEGHYKADLTIRNFNPAAILWFRCPLVDRSRYGIAEPVVSPPKTKIFPWWCYEYPQEVALRGLRRASDGEAGR